MQRILSTVILSTLMSCSFAGGFDEIPAPVQTKFHPLVGLNYSVMQIQARTSNANIILPRIPNPYNGIGFFGGFRYGSNFGLVLGYQYFFGQSRLTTINDDIYTVNLRPNNAYFEIRGYYPILQIKGLDLIGAAGVEFADFSSSYTFQGLRTYTPSLNVNLRVGLGLDYFFTRHWGLEVFYHYVPNHVKLLDVAGWKSFWTVTAGVDYMVE